MRITRLRHVLFTAAAWSVVSGCARDDVQEQRTPEASNPPSFVRQVSFVPGDAPVTALRANPFEGDTSAMHEGRRLYSWYNCAGGHFEGGGGIGPPFLDRAWIYGGEPEQIFNSIAAGRANGMPAFGDRVSADEIWKLALYVGSLPGQAQPANTSGGSVIHGP